MLSLLATQVTCRLPLRSGSDIILTRNLRPVHVDATELFRTAVQFSSVQFRRSDVKIVNGPLETVSFSHYVSERRRFLCFPAGVA